MKLNTLPAAHILDPGKPRVALTATRTTLGPNAPAQTQKVTARGGFFGRAARPQETPVEEEEEEEQEDASDGSDEEDEDDSPFRGGAKTNKVKFRFLAGFKDINGALSNGAASVSVHFKEIGRYQDDPDAFAQLDPSRTIPLYLRINGTSLSPEFERICAVEVYDAAGKPLYTRFAQKHNSADTAFASGYPLFLLHKGKDDNNIFFHPPELNREHETYWSFTEDTFEKNTSVFVNPSTGEQFKIIKKDSPCARLMQWALSVKNKIVINPKLLDNPTYQDTSGPGNIRLPIEMFKTVKAAFKKKLAEVQSTSFDLSTIKVVLKPLELAKELWRDRSSEPGVPNVNKVWGHIELEVEAYVPRRESDFGAGKRGAAESDGSDDGDL
jgi:hypothetical protein